MFNPKQLQVYFICGTQIYLKVEQLNNVRRGITSWHHFVSVSRKGPTALKARIKATSLKIKITLPNIPSPIYC